MNATTLPVLDHDLADDEIAWMNSVYADFAAECARHPHPKDALRSVLARDQYQLAAPADLSGPGPWRLGRNRHGRGVAAVFLPRVELHAHAASRTDQFAMYVLGEADAFSLDAQGRAVLTPVTGGAHFHNSPGAPHAFVPKVGQEVPEDWEIAFIAITPRNLQEDTQPVSDNVRATFELAVGRKAPMED